MLPTSLKTKITTPRLDETRDFYMRLFGLKIVEEWNEADDVGCILGFGDIAAEAFLEIYLGEQAHDFSGLSLQFRTGDLTAFQASLPSGIQTRGPLERPWGSKYLYLTDPNGIAIIVYEGGV